MKNTTKIVDIGRKAVRVIKAAVKNGLIKPEYPGEKPDRDSIRKLARRALFNIDGYADVMPVLDEKSRRETFDDYVYQRLRRDGTLKALRSL